MRKQKYSQNNIDIFWNMLLKEACRAKTTRYLDIFHFELSEKWANELLRCFLQVIIPGLQTPYSAAHLESFTCSFSIKNS